MIGLNWKDFIAVVVLTGVWTALDGWWWECFRDGWPLVEKSRIGTVRVTIPHTTPRRYRRHRFYAGFLEWIAWGLVFFWVVGCVRSVHRFHHLPSLYNWEGLACIATILCAGRLLRRFLERRVDRRVRKHEKAGRKTVIRIRRGKATWGRWPFRKKVQFADIYRLTQGKFLARNGRPATWRSPDRSASEVRLYLGPAMDRRIRLLSLARDFSCQYAKKARSIIDFAFATAAWEDATREKKRAVIKKKILHFINRGRISGARPSV
jgi:hypothetical protein